MVSILRQKTLIIQCFLIELLPPADREK